MGSGETESQPLYRPLRVRYRLLFRSDAVLEGNRRRQRPGSILPIRKPIKPAGRKSGSQDLLRPVEAALSRWKIRQGRRGRGLGLCDGMPEKGQGTVEKARRP